ncbi:peptide ABC transporter substrate-binding protein [Paenibacillus tepidiphilus]|uniref:peptide ABC transporter substrate-binding protein n=1 Tax=Paenibacillus tepidiphilus TaxID=2608683 RepID=UPI0013A55EE7|nr:peptide ABC transporter substrate-binding protein [Paenibacillus tepidiphilus]
MSAANAKEILRIGFNEFPKSLDPAIHADTGAGTILEGLFEGLVRLDKSGKAVPGMAKSWTVSGDGMTYTFTLRSDARWSNKDRVQAVDFEYAWKRALDPETGSTFAADMFMIAGAEDYNKSRLMDVSKVGVKALSKTVLQVTLKEKTTYFLQALAEKIYLPVNAAVAKANANWATSAKSIVTNGPFTLKSWDSRKISLVRNPSYYAAKEIRFAEVQLLRPKLGATNATAAYIKKETDWVGGHVQLDYASMTPDIAGLVISMPTAGTYFYQFNLNERPFTNVKIRRALSMAIDREALIYGSPAFGFVPPAVRSGNLNYRTAVPDTSLFSKDITLAKQLLQEGLKEEGYAELPGFTVIVNDGDVHSQIAMSVISDWHKYLGIEASLKVQAWQELLNNRYSGNFTVARAGWTADYNDPAAMLEFLTASSPDNDTSWNNKQYDSYVRKGKQSADSKERIQLYAQAERLLMNQMGVIPLYYYEADVLHHPDLQNVYLRYDGIVCFTRGYWQ